MKGLMGLPTMGLLRLTNQLGTKGVRRRKKLKESMYWRSSAALARMIAICFEKKCSTIGEKKARDSR